MQCLARSGGCGVTWCSHSPCLLLRFLYSDEVQIGPETVMTTLYTAKKYAVPALEAHCVEFLKKHLRADNAFMLLTQVDVVAECPVMPDVCACVTDHKAGARCPQSLSTSFFVGFFGGKGLLFLEMRSHCVAQIVLELTL